MKSNGLAILLRFAALCSVVLSSSISLAQTRHEQVAEREMPEAFAITYHVFIQDFVSEADQRRGYASLLAQQKALQKKDKNYYSLYSDQFPGVVQDRKFNITIAQTQGKFYWHSDEKEYANSFIYDGKRSYYYDHTSHRMFVYRGFRLINGMTLPMPGRGFAEMPMVKHPSSSGAERIDGEIYCDGVDAHGKMLYRPGYIELTSASPPLITRSVWYNGTRKLLENIFSDYTTAAGCLIPKRIIENRYDQQRNAKAGTLSGTVTCTLKSFSPTAPPEEKFNPIDLLKQGMKIGLSSPEFVQWYYDDGREITVYYKPGKSLEEQVGIEDYQQKRVANDKENGKVAPRNYAGLGLLLLLLAVLGWKVVTALKAGRKA